jgi:MFS family permease
MPAPGGSVSLPYAWYVAILLFLTNLLNQIDRSLVSILLVPIQEELGASDTAMGFLIGFSFVLFYTALGIPFARWADRGVRVSIVALAVTLWSGMTALSGLARNFWELAAARLGVGVGEAGGAPPAHSLISDYFPPERRARPLALFGAGGHVGGSLGWLAGGWLDYWLGWRGAFLTFGLLGMAVGALIRFSLREPPRGQMERPGAELRDEPLGTALRTLLATRSYVHLQIGGSLYVLAGYGIAVWLAAFFERVHGIERHVMGTWLGSIGLVFGLSGALLGGWAGDRLSRRDPRWYLWLPTLTAILGLPLTTLFLMAPTPQLAFLCFAPHAMVTAMYAGPIYALTQAVVRVRTRALATAIHLFAVNLIGLGLGPILIGALNDALRGRLGYGAIRYTMLGAASLSLLGCVFFLMGARYVRGDLARRERAA